MSPFQGAVAPFAIAPSLIVCRKKLYFLGIIVYGWRFFDLHLKHFYIMDILIGFWA